MFKTIRIFLSNLFSPPSKKPIVTAKKVIDYKKGAGHLIESDVPHTILVCYQHSTLDYLLAKNPGATPSKAVSQLHLVGKIGLLGKFGIGAPSLAVKMEQLIELGAKKFIAVGTAGSLMGCCEIGQFVLAPKALAEDGAAHHYLPKNKLFAEATPELLADWNRYINNQKLPPFKSTSTWSFSAIFRETPADVYRVVKKLCGIVEMESATLYAIAEDKQVKAMALFVVSDTLTLDEWVPHFKERKVVDNLHNLADLAFEFCHLN
jgi:uridine phosphorylase